MKKSRFSESQIIRILKEAEGGRKVVDICRENGVSQATYYQWKAKFGGMEAPDIRSSMSLKRRTSGPSGSWPSRPWTPGAQGSPRQKRGKPAERRLALRYAIDVHGYQSSGPVS